MSTNNHHKAGFVNIIGRPNVGKSTLLNAFLNERLAITSHKAQTTRNRIFGILSETDYQIVFSDTPGIIDPSYKLQEKMMHYVHQAIRDADIMIIMVSLEDKDDIGEILNMILDTKTPLLFLINKQDQAIGSALQDKVAYWQERYPALDIFTISALEGESIKPLLNKFLSLLPLHPPYFPKEEITDKSERFICAETIREKILLHYHQEIPYSSHVVVTSFKEEENAVYIDAEIYVERDSQKGIIIGKNASMIKKIGIEARSDMEKFLKKKVHLKTFVKVDKDWRKDEWKLKQIGFQ